MGSYQLLSPPQTTANVASVDANVMRRPTVLTSVAGDDGATDVIPLPGEFQEVLAGRSRFVRSAAEAIGSRAIAVYAAALTLATSVLVVASLATATEGFPVGVVAALAALAFFAERQSVRLTPDTEITVAALPMLFAAVTLGPLPAMVVAGLGLLSDCRPPYLRWIVWTSSRCCAAGLAGLSFQGLAAGTPRYSGAVVGVAVATGVGLFVDAFLNATTLALRGKGDVTAFVRMLRPLFMATLPFYTAVIALLAAAYNDLSAWSILLFFAPAFGAHRFYHLYRQEQISSQHLKDANDRIERASISFAAALVAALDARDHYTAGHSAAVAVYASDIARQLGLSEDERQLAHLCGLLHDVGKVGLPPGLLEKEGPLTPVERRLMEDHVVIGERILANVEGYREVARLIRHHHERVDGDGYPDRLSDESIPLISRIIGVADAFSAMTSGRPYRAALPTPVARQRIRDAAGGQFDPRVVAAFEAVLDAASHTYARGTRSAFAFGADGQDFVLRPAAAVFA